MSRAKELADRIRDTMRRECKNVGAFIIGTDDATAIAAQLDELHAIKSAAPDEMQEIADRQSARMITYGPKIADISGQRRDIEILVALVQRQAGEIAELRAHPPFSIDARLSADLTTARAEVERLKERAARDDAGVTIHACPPKGAGVMPCCDRPPFEVMGDRMTTNPALVNCDRKRLIDEVERLKAQLAEHADHPHLYICPQVAKSAADMGKERDAFKATNTALAAENARLVNEHAAAVSRADVLAEGVRVYRELVLGGDYVRCGVDAWERNHGHMASK